MITMKPPMSVMNVERLHWKRNTTDRSAIIFKKLAWIRKQTSRPIGFGCMNRVWSIERPTETVILKGRLPGKHSKALDYRRWAEMQREGIVGAAISWHPRIVSNYGLCGLNVLGEYLNTDSLYEFIKKNDPFCNPTADDDPTWMRPMNLHDMKHQPLLDVSGLNVTQKLRLSLDMAESLAVLHNHPDGAIVHADLWIGQYLMTNDGKGELRAKLNDFNVAEFLHYNSEQHDYCPYVPGKPRFDYEGAPEDVHIRVPSGSARDIFRHGQNMVRTNNTGR